ncbi:MAG: putative glycoside hydrolase [Oscillibacter sp.]|jgi:hypothetical protein|nr:putative glycoside hydrolase [Oscillibacter sp.]
MSGSRGYSSYRGRRPTGKIAAAVILILIILAAVGFMIVQKYLVYDESGTPQLQLPERQAASSSADGAVSSGELNLTIDQPKEKPVRAVQLTQTPLTDWTAGSGQLTAVSAGAACLTVKDAQGHVYYDSAAAAALSDRAVRTESSTAAAIAAMTASDTYTIARLDCLRDPVAAKTDQAGMALENTGGYIFYDGNNDNWLDPAKPGTVQYLSALVQECAALGFDEILLTDVTYPTQGKVSKIAYTGSAEDPAENLTPLVRSLRTALSDYPEVKLSVELPAAAITAGGDEKAGISLNQLAAETDRIYAQTEAGESSAFTAAVQAAAGEKKTGFVPELAAGQTPPQDNAPFLLLS